MADSVDDTNAVLATATLANAESVILPKTSRKQQRAYDTPLYIDRNKRGTLL